MPPTTDLLRGNHCFYFQLEIIKCPFFCKSFIRVTSRDVESLVDSSTLPVVGHAQPPPTPPDSRFKRTEYQNVSASGKLDAERSVRQHSVRKTVATASLQIVLLSKPLLCYVGLHANDPLGTLLNPRRVLGLLLGVDESKDIMDIHRSGTLSSHYFLLHFELI